MEDRVVRKAPLHWFVGGVLLGLVQIAAITIHGPLGVSTEFVAADAQILAQAAPDYTASHPLISDPKLQQRGYGWWLNIGILVGAALAALVSRRWRLQASTTWWRENHRSTFARLLACFFGGFLILLGARFALGCTSGQFASGWAQLSLSAIPFTVTLLGFGMLAAALLYPRTPAIDK